MNRNLLTFAMAAAVGASLIATTSCQCNRAGNNLADAIDTLGKPQISETDLNKSKTILYTIPSPVEIAMLVKNSGVAFDEDIVNPVASHTSYESNFKLALNLGIYSADMSYASIFDQTQMTVQYMNTMKTMAEKLGIMQIMNDELISKLENKNNSRQDMLNLISEVYMNANAFLTENNRKSVAAMVLAGGWIEGLYIAMTTTDIKDKNNSGMIERIIFQKLSLETMISIVDENLESAPDDADMSYLKTKLATLKAIFDEISINNSGKITASTNAETRTTTISGANEANISEDIFALLRQTVTEIRADFVK